MTGAPLGRHSRRRKGTLGFAVAGGASRRMGRDKALLPWRGGTLLDHTIDRLRAACGAVRILSGPGRRYEDRGVPVEVDVLAGAGALGGICTGLLHVSGDDGAGLFLAVDLPDVPVALLARLIALAEENDAAVPVTERGPEPLCAVYRRTCLRPIVRRLAAGEHKMTSFWPDVRVREVGPDELATFGDPLALFRNVNTPEDYPRGGGPIPPAR